MDLAFLIPLRSIILKRGFGHPDPQCSPNVAGSSLTELIFLSSSSEKLTFSNFLKILYHRLGVAVLDGKLYACGGYDGSTFLRSVEMFDPRNNKWNPVAPMSVTRSRVALAANAGKLWAVGGYDGTA